MSQSSLPVAEPTKTAPEIIVTYSTTPAPATVATLHALEQAVAQALDRKRRLGQYAVFWQNGQVVEVLADELPSLP